MDLEVDTILKFVDVNTTLAAALVALVQYRDLKMRMKRNLPFSEEEASLECSEETKSVFRIETTWPFKLYYERKHSRKKRK